MDTLWTNQGVSTLSASVDTLNEISVEVFRFRDTPSTPHFMMKIAAKGPWRLSIHDTGTYTLGLGTVTNDIIKDLQTSRCRSFLHDRARSNMGPRDMWIKPAMVEDFIEILYAVKQEWKTARKPCVRVVNRTPITIPSGIASSSQHIAKQKAHDELASTHDEQDCIGS